MRLATPEEIHYDELNFARCTKRLVHFALAEEMLFSVNTVNLKKLAILYYMIENNTNILRDIAEHCPNLEELELWHYSCVPSYIADDHLCNIKYMKNLRKLTLDEFPKWCSGSSIADVS